MGNTIKFLCLSLTLSLIFPSFAYAYLDPGTGSMILQALAATFVSALFFYQGLRTKIKAFFSKTFGNKKDGKDN